MFKTVFGESDGRYAYTYCNVSNPNEEYICISTLGTTWLYSLVTFKPANIPDAPTMVVDAYYKEAYIYLPRSVDEWEIMYFSSSAPLDKLDRDYLKNAGVVNLNEKFRKDVKNGLVLELSSGQYIRRGILPWPRWSIPDVDCSVFNELPGVDDMINELIGTLKQKI